MNLVIVRKGTGIDDMPLYAIGRKTFVKSSHAAILSNVAPLALLSL